MKSFFFLLSLFIPVLCFGQTIRGDYDLTNYPEISFVWNEYSPEIKNSTQFILTHSDEKIPFQLKHISPVDTTHKAKTILFLWEDLNHPQHAGQSDFTRQVLCNFLKDSTIRKEDKFNVAIFDRKGGNDLGSSIHTMLSDDFTSDREQLVGAIKNFKPKYDLFSKQVNSELYMAIEEGIDILQKESSDRIRAIIVFTAGSNQDSYGGRNSIDENRALSLKIPVYTVKYPIKGCEHCSNIDIISKKTYGLQTTTNEAELAFDLLKECYKKINIRHYGQDYRISFLSDYPRDGSQHAFVLNVGGKEYQMSFSTPAFSLKIWIEENILWTILIGIGLFLIIALLAFFIYRAIKKRRLKMEELQLKQQEIQNEADVNRQSLQDYRHQMEEKDRLDRERQIFKLMQDKNIFPRLQFIDNGKTIRYTVQKPEINIGRDEDNDLVLLSDSISRHHAKLIFNGVNFEIHDLGSTNKVVVNGAFVGQKTLVSGDIVGLGEIVIYFYS
ncbi:FHA domain-containing protein [Bacteroidales bacterium OttesenSCG-928-M06]|nr:FHA domain-containing protein [Bacteroidales bacterium OttesenSCG-928-M06]